ncbi:MAG: sigma-70 family RNA polymerase sigma factor [Patescibacteria group bacterium]|nr:sigma-70 family RNA polymerase sigma factor [Patescibacteria group bacterium]MDE2438147.1 sigma-70 family RNA polymerase sigma factor [Patescibacteria group bacterium]
MIHDHRHRSSETNEFDLIARAQEGDDNALEILIHTHLNQVYYFILQLNKNPKDAEDIAQETFIKMWKKLSHYKPTGKFTTWLLTIARNTTIDWMRKRRDYSFSEFEDEEGNNTIADRVTSEETPPDELLLQAEEKRHMHMLLGQLPTLYREVVFLRYEEHLSFEEIGTILHKPANTVRSQHNRALIALRKLVAHAPK